MSGYYPDGLTQSGFDRYWNDCGDPDDDNDDVLSEPTDFDRISEEELFGEVRP